MASKRTKISSTSKSNECSDFIDQTIHKTFSPKKAKNHTFEYHPLRKEDCCVDREADFANEDKTLECGLCKHWFTLPVRV